MITLLLLVPIIGSLIILPMNDENTSLNLNSHSNSFLTQLKSKERIRKIALITSLINLLLSIIIWFQFDSNTSQYQFVYEFNQLSFLHFNLGIDGISLYFVLLTTFITPVALLSNHTSITQNLKFFLISFLILETLQICAFISLDLLLFYVFFESAKWFGTLLLCLQLPNSGDTLKLKVPSYNRKIISGQNNYLGMVISLKMNENEMGYRGSKSIVYLSKIKKTFVKEQRVDGSYFGFILYP